MKSLPCYRRTNLGSRACKSRNAYTYAFDPVSRLGLGALTVSIRPQEYARVRIGIVDQCSND